MAERLTASLEDGTLEKLRELAGGERKVGAYLSQLVALLWPHREELKDFQLRDLALVPTEWIPHITMSPEEQRQQQEDLQKLQQDYIALRQSTNEIQRSYRELNARMEALAAARGVDWYSLPTQEDSSSNDA